MPVIGSPNYRLRRVTIKKRKIVPRPGSAPVSSSNYETILPRAQSVWACVRWPSLSLVSIGVARVSEYRGGGHVDICLAKKSDELKANEVVSLQEAKHILT